MANVSINNITETWSSSGTTYTGIKYNATDSGPSAAGSKLIDLQVGGVSKFSVQKDGTAVLGGWFTISPTIANINGTVYLNNGSTKFYASTSYFAFGQSHVQFGLNGDPTISRTVGMLASSTNTLKITDASTGFGFINGKIQTHANAVAETPTASHTITLYDATGTAYKVLAVPA